MAATSPQMSESAPVVDQVDLLVGVVVVDGASGAKSLQRGLEDRLVESLVTGGLRLGQKQGDLVGARRR